jgi:cell filamentation protein, protein adenylyltransferase|tara:strand:+ start:1076 stop:1657 length:582 start_codon:yes stop_codon:yes gene_type:complete
MDPYDPIDDPLCYPGSKVLINKANLTDQDALDQFEQLMFLSRSEDALPPGNPDYSLYKAIHHHFFQDVYEWAGKSRTIRTGKGGNWFCYPEFIDGEMEKLFGQLGEESYLTKIDDKESFAARASHYIAEINAVHPFREGNGRCQLILLNILLEMSRYRMNEDKLNPDQFLNAMIASFKGDNSPLSDAIMAVIE